MHLIIPDFPRGGRRTTSGHSPFRPPKLEAANFEKLPGRFVRPPPLGHVRLKMTRNRKPHRYRQFSCRLEAGQLLDFVPGASWYPREAGSFPLNRQPPVPPPVHVQIQIPSDPDWRYLPKNVTPHAKPDETTEMEVAGTDEKLKETRKILKEKQAVNAIR